MKEITVFIDRENVFNEVAKTTSYEGVKNDDNSDGKMYDKSFTVDADREMLERYWAETCTDISIILQRFMSVSCDGNCDEGFSARLTMDRSFDENMIPSINTTLTSLMIEKILERWYSLMPLSANGAVANLQAQHGNKADGLTKTLQKLLRANKGRIRRKQSVF